MRKLALWIMNLFLLALMSSSPALADGPHVTIKGENYYLGYIPKKSANAHYLQFSATGLPLSYDAVAAGKATPVKGSGQGSCGDCWAWARTSSLEAAVLAAGKPVTSLSEEDTTDNASDEAGCGGGSMDFNYEINHGVSLLSTCPWEGGGAGCQSVPAAQGATMTYVGGSNGPTDEDLMAAIYQYGSVAVTVAASGSFDTDSGSDRMTSCGSRVVDHMISAVAWRPSPDGGVEFKIKNSWGPDWGADGYAWMKRGCNQMALGDQSAMVISLGQTPPPPPPTSEWECTVHPAVGGSSYSGRGGTESAALSAAKKSCRADGHLFCVLGQCGEVSGL